MIPRGTPDIGWTDLAAGLVGCLLPGDEAALRARIESRWSSADDSIACLSVRSGFDLLLQTLALPHGSEVLVSAITIRDMLHIIEGHGLVAVPVDVAPDTLAVDAAAVARAIGPRTRAILIAHLFGSRMPLDAIITIAREHDLLVIEDCAQAYDEADYRGHPRCDVQMFSFGPIKTATALGGAVLRVRDAHVLAGMRERQRRYPRQRRRAFLQRIILFALLKVLAQPLLFQVFFVLCRLRHTDHDRVLSSAVRGFAGARGIERFRRQPCAPLLRLLLRRLAVADPSRITRRRAFAHNLDSLLTDVERPGAHAASHAHWVLPITSSNPDRLVQLLWACGFDATRHASSLTAAAAPPGTPPPVRAIHMMEHLIYLPMYPAMREGDVARLAQIVNDFEAH